MSASEKYVIVTTVSTFRMRYIAPVDEITQSDKTTLGTSISTNNVEEATLVDMIKEGNGVVESSQKWLGETVVDVETVDLEEAIKVFDKDNEFFNDLTREQKIKRLRHWKE